MLPAMRRRCALESMRARDGRRRRTALPIRPTPALAAAWSEVLRHGLPPPPGWRRASRGVDVVRVRQRRTGRGRRLAPTSRRWSLSATPSTTRARPNCWRRAAEVHALLERCGIRGDANGVLASRPRFCRRAEQLGRGDRTLDRSILREDRGVVMTGLLADSTGVGAARTWRRRAAIADRRRRGRSYPGAARHVAGRHGSVRASFPSRLRVFATHADAVDLKLAAFDPS